MFDSSQEKKNSQAENNDQQQQQQPQQQPQRFFGAPSPGSPIGPAGPIQAGFAASSPIQARFFNADRNWTDLGPAHHQMVSSWTAGQPGSPMQQSTYMETVTYPPLQQPSASGAFFRPITPTPSPPTPAGEYNTLNPENNELPTPPQQPPANPNGSSPFAHFSYIPGAGFPVMWPAPRRRFDFPLSPPLPGPYLPDSGSSPDIWQPYATSPFAFPRLDAYRSPNFLASTDESAGSPPPILNFNTEVLACSTPVNEVQPNRAPALSPPRAFFQIGGSTTESSSRTIEMRVELGNSSFVDTMAQPYVTMDNATMPSIRNSTSILLTPDSRGLIDSAGQPFINMASASAWNSTSLAAVINSAPVSPGLQTPSPGDRSLPEQPERQNLNWTWQ